jgi:hypothetical protein
MTVHHDAIAFYADDELAIMGEERAWSRSSRLSASRISSRIMSRIFSAPCGSFSKYLAIAAAAISGTAS